MQYSKDVVVDIQTWSDPKNVARVGKKLSTDFGTAGYVDWSADYLICGQPRTARLFLNGSAFGISVNPFFRRRKVGTELMYALINEATRDGYATFLILSATLNSDKFYKKVLKGLKKEGKIMSVDSFKKLSDGKDYGLANYRIRLKT